MKRNPCNCLNCISGKNKGAHLKKHVCNVEGCLKEYSKTNDLKKHISSHSREKQIRHRCECSNCASGKNINIMKKRHICSICNKDFGHTSQLKAHLFRHNDEQSPFKCNWVFCSKKFFSIDSLKRHSKSHSI